MEYQVIQEVQGAHFPSTEEAIATDLPAYICGKHDARNMGCPDEDSTWCPTYMRGFLDGLLENTAGDDEF